MHGYVIFLKSLVLKLKFKHTILIFFFTHTILTTKKWKIRSLNLRLNISNVYEFFYILIGHVWTFLF
jgi:hypothetical protein